MTGLVIGAAIEVHRELGPGEDEIAYEEALGLALREIGLPHERQKPIPLLYKGIALDCGFRVDVHVERRLPIELKSVESIVPIHEAQLETYMRLTSAPLGLLMNFDVPLLRDGIRRRILSGPPAIAIVDDFIPDHSFDAISRQLVESVFEVRRHLGVGLLRSAYEECLCHELAARGIPFSRAHRHSLRFQGVELGASMETPILLEARIPVFSLCVRAITRLHEGRLLARLRQANWPFGFLINFHSLDLGSGIRRMSRG